MSSETPENFEGLGLAPALLQALTDVGYETPSPIQARCIPLLIEGGDLVGQAQTGTGKTAAFALPLLSRLDIDAPGPQILVLAPTRELAIQVAEAFRRYAAHLSGFHVLPIYGGQDYRTQIRALQRGVNVVVGTPGRVMDHMRRGTLKLDTLSALVLDEADEMLRIGFLEDVEWILEQTPPTRQIALFSATMPAPIRRIADKHLNEPSSVTIDVKTSTADTIRQRYLLVTGHQKLDALTRILEAETFDGTLIFVRTKIATQELTEKLEARGYAAAPLNGDIPQAKREQTVSQLKKGKLDILVATDVAARGLDVERISHVINYDIPYDTEAYVHRIGRTGRAGRSGDAILFVAPREKRLLHAIEKATRSRIGIMSLPSTDVINDKRIERFKDRITGALAAEGLDEFRMIIEQYQREHEVSPEDVAAALAKLVQGNSPLLLKPPPKRENSKRKEKPGRDRGASGRSNRDTFEKPGRGRRDERIANERSARDSNADNKSRTERPRRDRAALPEPGMERYRIEVGHTHGVKPGNIVGAIANEAGIDSQYIGRIDIEQDHSFVDLPEGMPREVFRDLKKAWVSGQRLNLSRVDDDGVEGTSRSAKRGKSGKPKSARKPGKPAKVKKPSKDKKNKQKK